MRVVLDTNIIVSRFLSPQGIPARLIALWEQNTFELLVSVEIIAEYQRAPNYDHVRRRDGSLSTR
jgi:putative PIN family toxin of toxin-antitoxin system